MAVRDDIRRLRDVSADLLSWYGQNRRPLPWRDPVDPYHTWISEIMLQQTRIDVVIGYYKRFLEHFPDIPTLAHATEDELLKCWEGLGYYSRARNIGKAAGIIMDQYGGSLPGTVKELTSLPGIGDYTAAAISSIAFGVPVPAVDGNVLRVTARILEDDRDVLLPATRKRAASLLSEVIPADCPGDFNQALMELGETVCLPESQADCSVCPVRRHCLAFEHGTTDSLPVRISRTSRKDEKLTVFLIVAGDGSVAIRKRPDTGLLSGLFEFPNTPGHLGRAKAIEQIRSLIGSVDLTIRRLPDSTHIFSHKRWLMRAYRVQAAPATPSCTRGMSGAAGDSRQILFVPRDELDSVYPIPGAFSRFKEYITA